MTTPARRCENPQMSLNSLSVTRSNGLQKFVDLSVGRRLVQDARAVFQDDPELPEEQPTSVAEENARTLFEVDRFFTFYKEKLETAAGKADCRSEEGALALEAAVFELQDLTDDLASAIRFVSSFETICCRLPNCFPFPFSAEQKP